ncbi:MAG TPA: winged helix-turn-helix domain-containing protein [Propionibacteriaceae bacterium]|nr:winged helix-turn-helix domain-containing protein [Propionibacteriaceae bacterium]
MATTMTSSVPVALIRGLAELDAHSDNDWDTIMADIHDDITSSGPTKDTLRQVVETSIIIQQFLLEVACQPRSGYTRELVVGAAASLLLDMIIAEDSPGARRDILRDTLDSFSPGHYTFGTCSVDPNRRKLSVNRQPVQLSHTLWEILLLLLTQRNRVITNTELQTAVWGDIPVPTTLTSSAIRLLRQKLGDDGRSQTIIRTVWGQGYRFVAELNTAPDLPRGEHVSL